MQVGLIGAGNMARAMARGWGDPVICSDGGSGRAAEIVAEVGGEAVSSNREVAEKADLVVLCHKPAQLAKVAAEVAEAAQAVVSVLGGTPLAALQDAYPDTAVFAVMPNTPVEVRRGVAVYAERSSDMAPVDADLEARVLELFGRLGTVIRLPEKLYDVAGAIHSVGPAYQALLVEAQVDAAVRVGMPARVAAELVAETMTGTAALLAQRGYDTLAVRREVTSPGGSTARGLEALERLGIRAAFQAAMEAVVKPAQGRR